MSLRELKLSELYGYVPVHEMNEISFLLTEEDLRPAAGKKIIEFLNKLERKKINYVVIADSLPLCIFDSEQRNLLKSFKLGQRSLSVSECVSCIYFVRKKCKGIISKALANRKLPGNLFDFLSIDDMSFLTRFCSEKEKIKINTILDQMYKTKSKNAQEVSWSYPESLERGFDYDFVFHYLENKLGLGRKDESVNNEKLIEVIKKTYAKRKDFYLNKDSLQPEDNRWAKFTIMMCWLDLFDTKEKELWIKKYATYKFNEGEPKLPQAWNRVWAFTQGLGIKNIEDLRKFKFIDYDKSNKIISDYIPHINDIDEQNVFCESRTAMLYKYIMIRRFCNRPLFDELDWFLSQ